MLVKSSNQPHVFINILQSFKHYNSSICNAQIKKISVFTETGLKILGRVYTNIFFSFLKAFRISKCIKLYVFPENLKKILGFTYKFI